jgi:phenylacetate-CoA ligase
LTTTGNTLYSETREEIETAFGCKIFDSYNCEGNSTVFECPTHTCYHSAEEYGISEVLDENGFPIRSGVGRLISTDLWNFAYPFIRYDTQDMIEISDKDCSCGRKHLRINKIIGRDNDVLVSSNGRKFIVHNFTGFFHSDLKGLKRAVDQFQVVHLKNGNLLFRLIINGNYDQSVREFIISYWRKEFDSPVEVEIVEKIPLINSGKRKFIIIEK